MSVSTGRLILQRHRSQRHLGKKISALLKRSLSAATATEEADEAANHSVVLDLPTRHSWKQGPRACQDVQELQESTASILDQPLGSLYVSDASGSFKNSVNFADQRDEVYEVADATIQRVEYLMRGHASFVEGSLHHKPGAVPSAMDATEHLGHMQQLLERMQQEGNLYMRLREEHLKLADGHVESGETREEVESEDEGSKVDFAPPGATVAMYDAILDAMAVQPKRIEDPLPFFETSLKALHAFESDAPFLLLEQDARKKQRFQQRDAYTVVTPVTYNAALRGIAEHTDFANPRNRDIALNSSFHLYNHWTHSEHLLRNSASIGYMLQIVNQALPDSRVKGNISVTFWKQACQMGLATPALAESMQSIHRDLKCGPEFEPVLEQVKTPLRDLPQRYRRAVKQTRHSTKY